MQKSNIDNKGFYITTAIAYPNSNMHVGFGWEVIGSDMVARFQRMNERTVFFSTGTDEHSQNVEKAAVKAGLSAKAYCDQMAIEIEKVMGQMDIAYDRFIRTSDSDHEKICQYLIEKAFKAGDVYKQKYVGLYCESCEVFYTEKEAQKVNNDFICPTHKLALKPLSEENYFFKLSHYEEKLKKLFKEQPNFLQPESRRNEVMSFIEQGLKDFSVSRTSFKWGISLPFDPQHIIYVWYDALINYLSAIKMPIPGQGDEEFFKKFWPCDVHVIGKDITRFHCVYWPAMLWSAGIELPSKVWAHGFINLQGEKMSKTHGNIVTPDEVIADFGSTALRWYLIASNNFDADGNYSNEALVLKCNADLSNNIGNLVNRVLSMSRKYFGENSPNDKGKLPSGVDSVGRRLENTLGARAEKLIDSITKMNLSGYCTLITEFSMAMNKFIDETKPWALAKAGDVETLETVIAQLLEGIRNLGIALWPVIPQASEGILTQLGFAQDANIWQTQTLETGKHIRVPRWRAFGWNSKVKFGLQEPKPLFPRFELKPKTS